MATYINPVRDMFIKFLFGTDENKDLLLSFINAVLVDSDFPLITSVELKNPFNYKTFVLDKESILDVKATDENGRIYDIEVQANDFEHFEKRSLYYWAKLYSSQMNEGSLYSRLKPVICINLIDGVLFEGIEKLHSCFLLTEKNNSEYVLTDHLMLHYLEIEKIRDSSIRMELKKWVDYFKKEGKEDMTILLKDDPIMRKAHRSYQKFTQDDELRELYEAREKWRRDYASGMETAEKKGMAKGMAEGMAEGRAKGIAAGMAQGKAEGSAKKAQEMALKMKKKGLPLTDIAEISGLSIDEIKKLS